MGCSQLCPQGRIKHCIEVHTLANKILDELRVVRWDVEPCIIWFLLWEVVCLPQTRVAFHNLVSCCAPPCPSKQRLAEPSETRLACCDCRRGGRVIRQPARPHLPGLTEPPSLAVGPWLVLESPSPAVRAVRPWLVLESPSPAVPARSAGPAVSEEPYVRCCSNVFNDVHHEHQLHGFRAGLPGQKDILQVRSAGFVIYRSIQPWVWAHCWPSERSTEQSPVWQLPAPVTTVCCCAVNTACTTGISFRAIRPSADLQAPTCW